MQTFDSIQTETVRVVGFDNDEIPLYVARPVGPGPFPGIVLLHHAPGWDQASKEVVRTLAVHGYISAMPNLHFRDAPPDATAEEAGGIVRMSGNVPDLRCIGDVEGSYRYIQADSAFNGRMACMGFCFGGREAFVCSGHIPFDATIICYGGSILLDPNAPPDGRYRPNPERRPFRAIDLASNLKGPVLGLFGMEDPGIPPSDVEGIANELTNYGVQYEIYDYEGAGHAFMGVDQKSFRWRHALDAWSKIFDFGDRYLYGDGTDNMESKLEIVSVDDSTPVPGRPVLNR